METIFTHRPLAGVSVGARNVAGTLFVAFSLVNDGTSRNGVMWGDRRDRFCRRTARAVLNGRLDGAVENGIAEDNNLILAFESDISARKFIASFRETFKPVPDETDDFLSSTVQFGEGEFAVDLRFRPYANEIVERLTELANEVTTQCV